VNGARLRNQKEEDAMAEQYRCDRCNQEFPNQDQLNRHNQQQHQGGGQQGGEQQRRDGEAGSQRT
jgi:hypothetical protein